MSNDQTPSTKLYVPAMAGLYDGLSGLAYPFIRLVTGVTQVPLLPGFLVLVLVVGGMMAAWYREGR